MDVLQLLKMEFKERLAELTALIEDAPNSSGVFLTLARLKAHLSLEEGYLLPELSALTVKNDIFLTRIESELVDLQNTLGQLAGREVTQSELEQVRAAFFAHVQGIEDRILPLMRQKITTAEREELFFVLQDAKQDLFKSVAVEHAM